MNLKQYFFFLDYTYVTYSDFDENQIQTGFNKEVIDDIGLKLDPFEGIKSKLKDEVEFLFKTSCDYFPYFEHSCPCLLYNVTNCENNNNKYKHYYRM